MAHFRSTCGPYIYIYNLSHRTQTSGATNWGRTLAVIRPEYNIENPGLTITALHAKFFVGSVGVSTYLFFFFLIEIYLLLSSKITYQLNLTF